MKTKSIIATSILSLTFAVSTMAAITPPPPMLPTDKDDCKKGGWEIYGIFKNQGDCVSFVATDGRNEPAGL